MLFFVILNAYKLSILYHITYKVDAVPVAIPAAESLTVEFKSDRNGYPDRELIGALTCLANTLGGELWLGIEDDGTASGLHRKHHDTSHLAALIASQTHPRASRHYPQICDQ